MGEEKPRRKPSGFKPVAAPADESRNRPRAPTRAKPPGGIEMKTHLLAVTAAALAAVLSYVDVAAAASGAYSAGQVAGKVFLAVLIVAVVVSLVRRVRAGSGAGG
jgi:lysylphosphatidylglycerol synthetase-like protein (DUF2156 family)